MRSFLAASLLVAWVGSYHHDTWLAFGGVDHHHQHEHSPAGDSDDGRAPVASGDEDHHDSSLPLPDTHSVLVAVSAKKISVPASVFAGDFTPTIPSLSIILGRLISGGSEDLPRNVAWPGLVPPRHLILAGCVQANAPPLSA